jgi:VWFA-related protein
MPKADRFGMGTDTRRTVNAILSGNFAVLRLVLACRPRLRSCRLAVAAIVFSGWLSYSGSAWAQAATQSAGAGDQDQSAFKVHVESNLVVVRTIVRDAQGHPVGNLRKEDFKLLDNGKEQTISQFSVETRAAIAPQNPTRDTATAEFSAPTRFLALYFDDLDMVFDDVVRARDAADRFLAANLGPSDRAGIFTSSGSVAVDFTSDLKKLHEVLFKLRSNSRVGGDCPNITDYQAKMIVEWAPPPVVQGIVTQAAPTPGSDALAVAIDDARNICDMPMTGQLVYMLAQRVLGQYVWQAQYSLDGLKDVVNHISAMPGQRTVVLVSPGFMTSDFSSRINAIVDRALRSQVVVSSIDSKGLAVLVAEADARRRFPMDAHLAAAQRDLSFKREQAALAVLADVAEGTGCEFFHNDSDLNSGLRKVTTLSEISYILAFAPKNLKPDGRFHVIKVTLRDRPKGVTLQARRGYFAPRAGAKPEDELAEEIRSAVLSTEEIAQLPLHIITEVSRGPEKDAGKTQLAVMGRLEVGPLHFKKDDEHNRTTLTFVSCIFDHDGLYVSGQQKQVQLDLPDAKLRELIASPGILVIHTFQLVPGTYSIREVVMDSEEHHIGALSRSVTLPEFQGKGS